MITPYYEREQIRIYCADARDLLTSLEANSIDLIVTDPPYGVAYYRRALNWEDRIIANDEQEDVTEILSILAECVRVLRAGRHMYVFGDFDLSTIQGISATCTLIWDKGVLKPGDLRLPWARNYEPIQFAVHGHKSRSYGTTGLQLTRMRRGAILRYPWGSVQVRHHMTEKPIGLLRELIEVSSREGELVLDPFMGSGTTLLAAILEGRQAIGCDIEMGYAEIAARRVDRLLDAMEYLRNEGLRGLSDEEIASILETFRVGERKRESRKPREVVEQLGLLGEPGLASAHNDRAEETNDPARDMPEPALAFDEDAG